MVLRGEASTIVGPSAARLKACPDTKRYEGDAGVGRNQKRGEKPVAKLRVAAGRRSGVAALCFDPNVEIVKLFSYGTKCVPHSTRLPPQ